MSVEEFGVISIFQAILIFLAPLLSLSLSDSVARFYNDWLENERGRNISSIWSLSIIIGFVLCILLSLFGHRVDLFFFENVKFKNLWLVIVGTLFFNNLSLIPTVVIKAEQRIRLFNTLTFLSFVVSTTFSFVCIIIFKQGALGYIYGTCITSGIFGIYYAHFIYKKYGFYLDFSLIRKPFKYSLPLLPSAIIDNFFNSADRFILNRFFGLSTVGLYDLANRLSSSIGSVNQALKSVWVPLIFAETSSHSSKQGPEVYSRLSFLYVCFMIFIGMGFYLFSDLLVLIFDDTGKFQAVLQYLPFLIIIYVIQSISTALGRGIDIAKRTNFSAIVPLAGLIVFLGLVFFFKTHLTFSVFLIILVGANLFRSLIQIYFSYAFYPRPVYYIKYLLLFSAIALAVIFTSLNKEDTLWIRMFLNFFIYLSFTTSVVAIACDGQLTKLKQLYK